ncbi:unnamed protein product, partial [Discosporangium mesarthrocarpum]
MSGFDAEVEGNCPAPAFGPESELTCVLKRADELSESTEDSEREPYRSKYDARDILLKAKTTLALDGPELALIDYRLGVIGLAVEENSAAETSLNASVDVFFPGLEAQVREEAGDEVKDDTVPMSTADRPSVPTEVPAMIHPSTAAHNYPVEAANSLIHLGVLWSQRGFLRRSLLFLLASLGFCQHTLADMNAQVGNSSNGQAHGKRQGGEQGEGQVKGRGQEERGREGQMECTPEKMESRLTHTFYYLAQVYTGLEEMEQSAKYCTLTLQRQLDAEEKGVGQSLCFDAVEWSRNASSLAVYQLGLGNFRPAGQSLAAAQGMWVEGGWGGGFLPAGEGGWDEAPQALMSAKEHPKNKGPEGGEREAENVEGAGKREGVGAGAGQGGDRDRGHRNGEAEEDESLKEQRSEIEKLLANLYILVLEVRRTPHVVGGGA